MTEYFVEPLPENPVENIRTVATEMRLEIASEGTLRSIPGSVHWHFRKPGVSGTLEATWHPSTNRMWVCYQSNRIGNGWVVEAAEAMAAKLIACSS